MIRQSDASCLVVPQPNLEFVEIEHRRQYELNKTGLYEQLMEYISGQRSTMPSIRLDD